MSPRRWIVALLVGAGVLAVPVAPAAAQLPPIVGPTTTEPGPDPTLPPTTEDTTTTEPPATTEPEPETEPAPTSAVPAGAEDPTTTEGSSATTTSSIPLLVDGPPVFAQDVTTTTVTGPTTTLQPIVTTDEGRTGRQVGLAVAGLLVLAIVFASLTWWYWRRTKPRTAPAGTR